MTQAMAKLHEGQHPSGVKYKVGTIMHSKWMELIVVILILCDLVLVAVEVEIDYHIVCVAGQRLRIPHHKLMDLRGLESSTSHGFLAQQPAQDWERALSMFREQYRDPSPAGRKNSFSAKKGLTSILQVRSSPEGAEGAHAARAEPDLGKVDDEEVQRRVRRARGEATHEPGSLICEDKYGHTAHWLEQTCHFWSTLILCLFMLELCIKIWVGPRAFLTNAYHVFDLVVVTLSLVFDILSHFLYMFDVEMVALILIICRLWRVARIIHALFEVVHTQVEQMDELKREIAESQAEAEKLQDKIKRFERRSA